MMKRIETLLVLLALVILGIACGNDDDDDNDRPPDDVYIDHSPVDEPGPFAVGLVTIADLEDTTRTHPDGGPRPIPLEVTYPAISAGEATEADTTGAPYPVIVLSHGLIANKSIYRYLSHHLTSHGYVVVAPDHVTSNTDYILGAIGEAIQELGLPALLDNPDELMEMVGPELLGIADEVIDRPLDIRFVVDSLSEINDSHPQLAGMLHATRIGITGHSYGGFTTIAAAGGWITPNAENCPDMEGGLDLTAMFGSADEVDADILGCFAGINKYSDEYEYPVDLSDDRLMAAMPLAPAASALFGPEGMTYIDIPMMLTGGTEDTLTPYETEQLGMFPQLTHKGQYLYTLYGAGHLNFNDEVEDFLASWDIPGLPFDLSTMDPEALGDLLGGVGLDLGPLFTPSMEFPRAHRIVNAMAVAFFGRYVKEDPYYDTMLSAEWVEENIDEGTGDVSLEARK